MIEKYALKILDFFQPLFRMFRIDYPIMRKILQMKLRMDERRVPTIFQSQKKQKGNQFLQSLGIYALFGLVTIIFIFMGENYILWTSLMFGLTMFILGTTMISDYSSVLLDVRDKVILNTKPVSMRTVNTAKVIHIAIYLILLLIAFSGIPSLVILTKHGLLFYLIYIINLVLVGFLIIALTALVYITVLRFFSGERLKDMINYVQILLSVGVFVGYQVIARVFDFVGFEFAYSFSWWHIFIPPLWFGAPFELLINQNFSGPFILLSLLALFVPIVALVIYFTLMPSFEQNLEKLLEETEKGKRERFVLSRFFSRFICTAEERKYFQFSSILISEERDFKLRVYPSLGMGLFLPFFMIFNQLTIVSFSEVAKGKMYLMIYFSNIIIAAAIHTLRYSSNYEGSWLIKATVSMEDRAPYYRAAIKAFLLKLYTPIFILISVIFIWIFSVKIIPDLITVFIIAILTSIISFIMMDDGTFPFSQPFETSQEGGSAIMMILLMFVVGVFAVIHFMITFIPHGHWYYLILVSIVTPISWRVLLSKERLGSG